jgi:hypothetical protein
MRACRRSPAVSTKISRGRGSGTACRRCRAWCPRPRSPPSAPRRAAGSRSSTCRRSACRSPRRRARIILPVSASGSLSTMTSSRSPEPLPTTELTGAARRDRGSRTRGAPLSSGQRSSLLTASTTGRFVRRSISRSARRPRAARPAAVHEQHDHVRLRQRRLDLPRIATGISSSLSGSSPPVSTR